MGLFSSDTTTKPVMFGPSKDLMKDVLKDASGYFNWQTKNPNKIEERSGAYTGQGYAGLDQSSNNAFDGLTTLANNNSGGYGMGGALNGILQNGGYTSGQRDVMGATKSLTNNGQMNSLINGNGLTGAQNDAYGAMQNTVSGNNSALQDRFNNGGFDANQAAAYAGLNSTVNNNNAAFANTFARGGFDERQAAAYDDLNRTVAGNNAALGQTIANGGMTGDQRGAMDRYTQQATTPFEFNQDFIKNRQNALDTQGDALSLRAASAGRYGGGMDQAILAREQGNLASRMNQEQLAQDQNQKNIANSALMAGGQNAVGNQINVNSAQQQGYNNLGNFGQIGQQNQQNINSAQQQGYNNITNMGQVGYQNQLSANDAIRQGQQDIMAAGQMGVQNNSAAVGQKAGLEAQLFNMQQAGLGNMGDAYNLAQQPYQTMRAVGLEKETQDQKRINDEMRIKAELDPMARYQQFLGLATGTPTGSTQTTSPSWAQLLAGGGLGVLGLGSALSGLGGATAPAGSTGAA